MISLNNNDKKNCFELLIWEDNSPIKYNNKNNNRYINKSNKSFT